MRILITGAGGLLGRHLTDAFARGNEVLARGRHELDVADSDAVGRAVSAFRPDLIVNCAVLGVDACEREPRDAERVNVIGPANLAAAAAGSGAAILHFSTNYVFAGDRPGHAYREDDEARPLNVYGRTKSEGERVVAGLCPRHFVIRTSWVFGGQKRGSFSDILAALSACEHVYANDLNVASTTYVRDLAARTESIVALGRFGTFHAVNAGWCTRYEFVVEAARILGVPLHLVSPAEGPPDVLAARPHFSPLACSSGDGLAPLRHWKDALREHLTGASAAAF